MSPYKNHCPKCQRKLMLPKSSGHVRCPKCGHRFLANGALESYPVAAAAPVESILSTQESGPPSSTEIAVESDMDTQAAYVGDIEKDRPNQFDATDAIVEARDHEWVAAAPSNAAATSQASHASDEDLVAIDPPARPIGAFVAIGAAAVVVLGLGVWLLAWSMRGAPSAEELPEPPESLPFAVTPHPTEALAEGTTIALAAAKIDALPKQWVQVKTTPLQGAVKPVAPAGHPGVDQAKVDQAIQRGAAFLEASHNNGVVGAQALAGLTLLHCGRPTDNPAVQNIARAVRSRAPGLTQTYELATCVMFLDRHGDPADQSLIRSIALQLIAGQGIMGGWNYGCQSLNASQQQQLLNLLAASKSTTMPTERAPAKQVGFGGRASMLPQDLTELPVFQYRPGTLLQHRPHGHEDNSLTQFAILALWSAQKHGIPAERSLAFAEARFRSSQAADGTWGYTWTQPQHRNDSMTCAGLIGLAVGRGSHSVAKGSLAQGDPAIEKGLRYVGQRIGNLSGGGGQRGNIVGAATWGDLYYLWTLERAAVVYDLQTIGGKDWYAWGAPIILKRQDGNGAWSETHGPVADTCFALLFLKRANVAVDLTARLQGLAISKQLAERGGLDSPTRGPVDPFDRRPDLNAQQREAAGYSRGRMDER